MKIRIKGNFVRYRLTQSEVLQLKEKGLVSEETHFGPRPDQVFAYTLEADTSIADLSASFSNNTIRLLLPKSDADAWYDSDRVGFKTAIEVAPGVQLSLLLEKDFVCLDDTQEDQSDNYPNPLMSK